MLLTIGTLDCSSMITKNNYTMNVEDLYEEWTDAWGRKHRNIYGTRISGKVTMKPTTNAEYEALTQVLHTGKRSDGVFIVKAFVNNLNEIKQFNAFIEEKYEMAANTSRKFWKSIELEIEEQ